MRKEIEAVISAARRLRICEPCDQFDILMGTPSCGECVRCELQKAVDALEEESKGNEVEVTIRGEIPKRNLSDMFRAKGTIELKPGMGVDVTGGANTPLKRVIVKEEEPKNE